MPFEHERKFLAANDSWRTAAVLATGRFLMQGYFTKDQGYSLELDSRTGPPTLRMRIGDETNRRLIEARIAGIFGRQRTLDEVEVVNDLARAGQPYEARIRKDGDASIIAVKVGDPRHELEFVVDGRSLPRLWDEVESGLITKTRYRHRFDGVHVAEIDEYSGPQSGLVVIEVETKKADTVYVPPGYFGREVTGQKQYSNAVLAYGNRSLER